MDKNTRNLLLITAGILAWSYWVNNKDNKDKKVENELPSIKLDNTDSSEDINNVEIQEVSNFNDSIETLEFGQLDDFIGIVKKSLSWLSKTKINSTNIYDTDLLFLVQVLMKDSPALFDNETGRICKRLFLNLDYILRKLHSEDKPTSRMKEIDNSECEWIKKGDKGKDVLKLNTVICFLTGKKEENALFTKEYGKTVDSVFAGSQIYDNSTNENKVCKMWVYSIYKIIENTKELNEKTN